MKKNFTDFWTHDMKQFYDESWGHENFNHETSLSFMSVEKSKWKISPVDQAYMSYKRINPNLFCPKCKERGHLASRCPKKNKTKCSICGAAGHLYHECPNAICTTCRSVAKYHTTRCSNCSTVKFLQCDLCKAIGHEIVFCPDLWRRYHQTTNDCEKLSGCTHEPLKEECKLWCPNCANQGHTADKCTQPHHDRILSSTTIFSYEATYDNDFKLKQSCLQSIEMQSVIKAPTEKKLEKLIYKNDFKFEQSGMRSLHENSKTRKLIDKHKMILEKLKKHCKQSDSHSLKLINRYLKDLKKKRCSKKKIQKIQKLQLKIMNKS